MSPEPGLSKGRELTGLKQKVSALENQLTHVREQIEKLRSAAPTRKAQAYERGNVVVDPLRCTGCGMCEAICPVGAIKGGVIRCSKLEVEEQVLEAAADAWAASARSRAEAAFAQAAARR